MGDLFIFVICKDTNFRDYICNLLLMDGHYVESTDDMNNAKQKLRDINFDLVIISLSDLSQNNDYLLEEEIHEINKETEVVFIINTDKKLYERHISKKGKNYLIKPFIMEDLPLVIDRILQTKHLKEEKNNRSIKNGKNFKERRGFCRLRANLPIKYTFISPLGNIPSDENITKILNISPEGVMFKIDCKAKFLETVFLNILLPSSNIPINIIGDIKWERSDKSGPWRYIGVRFANINQSGRKNLESFIYSHKF